MSPGRRARSMQLGNLYDDVLDRPEEAAAFLPASSGQVCRNRAMRRTKARRETISPTRCASSAAWTKRGRKSAGRSNATRSSATRLSRGKLGPSSPTSRRTPATRPPPRRRSGNAIACYLAYRRDGGENYNRPGRLCLRRDPKLCSPATGLRPRRFSSNSPPVPRTRGASSTFIRRPPGHRRRQPRPRPRRRPGFGLRDGRGNPLPDRDAGETWVGAKQSPPRNDRRASCT